MTTNVLTGITRGRSKSPPKTPDKHSPLVFQNSVEVECWGPEGLKQRVEDTGNILNTFGLNRLIEQLTLGTGAFSDAGWVDRAVIGTDNTTRASGDDSMGASTASKAFSDASMVASDSGALTMAYQITFDAAGAYDAQEVALFGSNADTASMVAHKTFALVSKAANDTVRVTYKIIAGTAA